MKQEYCIVATDRVLNKRVMITGAMSEQQAFDWKADGFTKKSYKYFRVAKFPYKS